MESLKSNILSLMIEYLSRKPLDLSVGSVKAQAVNKYGASISRILWYKITCCIAGNKYKEETL